MTTLLIDRTHLARYRSDGYTTLPRLTTEAELGRLGQIYDRLFADSSTVDNGDYYDIADTDGTPAEQAKLPQIIRPEKYAPELLDTEHFRTCLAAASALLDCPAQDLDHYGHMIRKPAGYGAETPWHQDEAYMDPTWQRRGLSIWMPLEPATVATGCLHFVPGSHRADVVTHRHINHDDRVRGLMTDLVEAQNAVACPLDAGAASVHDLRTLHYAGPNTSDAPRRAYVIVFTTPAVQIDAEPHPWLA